MAVSAVSPYSAAAGSATKSVRHRVRLCQVDLPHDFIFEDLEIGFSGGLRQPVALTRSQR